MYSGKALYQPKGKAEEYSAWAVNFYNGCANHCSYCYLRRGPLAHAMGGDTPVLKKCFKDEGDAFETFQSELLRNRKAVTHDGGLFFSFSTDPCLQETLDLTLMSVAATAGMKVPSKILTKCADWILENDEHTENLKSVKDYVAVGFTITGRDDLEPDASPTAERLQAMIKLHTAGIRTFASIEPIIDPALSFNFMSGMTPFCDHFKVGLQSGRQYTPAERTEIGLRAAQFVKECNTSSVYFKESIRTLLDEDTLNAPICVEKDYNIFKNR